MLQSVAVFALLVTSLLPGYFTHLFVKIPLQRRAQLPFVLQVSKESVDDNYFIKIAESGGNFIQIFVNPT